MCHEKAAVMLSSTIGNLFPGCFVGIIIHGTTLSGKTHNLLYAESFRIASAKRQDQLHLCFLPRLVAGLCTM